MATIHIDPEIDQPYCLLFERLKDCGYLFELPNALRKEKDKYRVALYQHSGTVIATKEFVRNKDQAAAEAAFKAFFDLALVQNPDLLLTPEYSCPWSVIDWLLDEKKLPAPGQLWVIGCESITPVELQAKIDKYADSSVWCSELAHLNLAGPETFLDPVVYMLIAERDGKSEPVLALQFKNVPMADAVLRIEPTNLIRGKITYVLSDPDKQRSAINRLVTVICADSLEFLKSWKAKLPDWEHVPYVILHPQLTPITLDPNLASYRREIARTTCGQHYEFFSLNWAADSKIEMPELAKEISIKGQSARYMKPTGARLDDEPIQTVNVINENHQRGIYLRFCNSSRYVAYYFHLGQLVFLFDSSPVYMNVALPRAQRFGIDNAKTFGRSGSNGFWVEVPVLSDEIDYPPVGPLDAKTDPCTNKPYEREMLLTMATGEFMPKAPSHLDFHWCAPRVFPSMQINTEEESRGTLAKLMSSSAAAIAKTIQQFAEFLHNLLNVPGEYPEACPTAWISDVTIGVPSTRDGQWQNILVGGKPYSALLIYLGYSDTKNANIHFDLIRNTLNPAYLLLWYKENGMYQKLSSPHQQIAATRANSTDIFEGPGHEPAKH